MLHKITSMLSILFLMPVLTARGTADATGFSIPFAVHTHGVKLTEADLNAVLDEAQTLLNDNSASLSLDLNRASSLDPKTNNVVDEGEIKGCPDLTALLNRKDVNVHIVDSIPCCDDPTRKELGLVGCSGQGKAIIVLPGNSLMSPNELQLLAIQWLHELGHNLGLCHNICNDGSIMTKDPVFKDKKLDDCERQIFSNHLPTDPNCMLPNSCNQTCNGPQQ